MSMSTSRFTLERSTPAVLALAACLLSPLTACSPAPPEGSAKEETQAMTQEQAPAPAPDPEAGTLAGTVSWTGLDPDELVSMTADPRCIDLREKLGLAPLDTGTVVSGGASSASGGGLAHAFVYLSRGLEGKTFPPAVGSVEVDQKGCEYTPRVLGVRVGQTVVLANSDETIHNIRGLATHNHKWNDGLPARGMKVERRFDQPEVMVELRCDVHDWMRGYLGVLSHPYFAVTDASGRFEIPAVPAGTYTLTAWHERLGTREQEVTLEPRGQATVDFDFTESKAQDSK